MSAPSAPVNGRKPAIELMREAAAKKLETRKQHATKALLAEFDELNALLAAKEKELLEIHVPREVLHDYKRYWTDDQRQYERVFYIALAKYKGAMRLCHGEELLHCGHSDDGPEWRPIVECALDIRVEVAPHIAKLTEKVIEAAEASVSKVQQAIAALRG